MSLSIFPNLQLANAYSNVVNTNTLSGTISNSVDQTSATSNIVKSNNFSTVNGSGSVNFASATIDFTSATIDFNGATINNFPLGSITFTGDIAQGVGKTATLGNTSWNASSTVNFTNGTVSNLTILGANTNSVDNAALPTTITKNVSNTTTTATTIVTGTAGTGSLTYINSKNYTTANSNTALTIATISGLDTTATTKWKLQIQTTGTAAVEMAQSTYYVVKAGTTGIWQTYTYPSFSSTSTKLNYPTITTTPGTGTITVNQPSTTTDDGAVHYNVSISYVSMNAASPSTPSLS